MNDDFDPQKAIADLKQPTQFAELFCEAAKTQKIVDNILKDIVITVIKDNKDVAVRIKELMLQIEKENWKIKYSKFLWGFSVIFTAALMRIGEKLIEKFFP